MQIINPNTLPKDCNVTFIIGNGFDLGLNMKTKYADVYEGYIKAPSSSNVIINFKEELKSRSVDNYENWSDFEMGMAEYAKFLLTEDELMECVRDFKGYMVKHLQEENKRMQEIIKSASNQRELITELKRSLDSFHNSLIPNDRNQISKIMNGAMIKRTYITFNYTSTLESFLGLYFKHDKVMETAPVHIHGTLGRDVVLGIDNVEQIKGSSFSLTSKGERAFVKTAFNKQYDNARVDAAKNIILQSDVICIYGFSMGDSDKTWNDLLARWLIEKSNHHLVVYQYDIAKYNYYNYDVIMEKEDEKKSQLLKKLGNDRVHATIGSALDLFGGNMKFESVLEEITK